MRLRKRLAIWALTVLAGSACAGLPATACAQEAVWRASRPLRLSIRSVNTDQPAHRRQRHSESTSSINSWRARVDHLRHLRAELSFARAEADYLEGRLQSYRVFRFSDGMQKSIGRTQLALKSAQLAVAGIEAEIRRVSRRD